ncbi:MAG TPA: zinc-dependent metalloprotease family protein [Acidimicrobiales bacterium]
MFGTARRAGFGRAATAVVSAVAMASGMLGTVLAAEASAGEGEPGALLSLVEVAAPREGEVSATLAVVDPAALDSVDSDVVIDLNGVEVRVADPVVVWDGATRLVRGTSLADDGAEHGLVLTLTPPTDDPDDYIGAIRPVLRVEAWVGSRRFRVRPEGVEGLHRVSELGGAGPPLGAAHHDDAPPAGAGFSSASGSLPGVGGGDGEFSAASHSGNVLDIAYLYTGHAETAQGGRAGVRNFANQQANLTNQANDASGLAWDVAVVSITRTATADTNNSLTDLGDLQDLTDNRFDEAVPARTTWGADVVQLLGSGYTTVENICGRAYILSTVNRATFEVWAFGVLDVDEANCDATLGAHELGHNLSFRHDWETVRANNEGGLANKLANDSHGHFDPVPPGFKTIMSYHHCVPNPCADLVHWSDPDRNQAGRPLGVRNGTTNLLGQDISADNARVAITTGPEVAGLRTVGTPIGVVDGIDPYPGGGVVRGWAIDPDTLADVRIHVYVDGVGAASEAANLVRTDVAGFYPKWGNNRGFRVEFAMPPGTHDIRIYFINNTGGPHGSVTRTFSRGELPKGEITLLSRHPDGARVKGWAIDPDTSTPIRVHVYVDGVGKASVEASLTSPPISDGTLQANWTDDGTHHGFSAVAAGLAAGTRNVCAYGINVLNGGLNPQLGCQTITISNKPVGKITSQTTGAGGATGTLTGWALDPDTTAAINIRATLNGVTLAPDTAADDPNSSVAAAYPDYGANHGYTVTVPLNPVDSDTVCLTAINATGTPGSNTSLGCRTFA